MKNRAYVSAAELKQSVKKQFCRWIAVSLCVLAVIIAYHLITREWSACRAAITFSYDGIDSGKLPSGSPFDETELKNETVIRNAAAAMELPLDEERVAAIQAALDISGSVPNEIFEEISTPVSIFGEEEVASLTSVRSTAYYPSVYTITFHSREAGLTGSEGRRFLEELLSAYDVWFYETYGFNQSLKTALNSLDYNTYDYVDAIEVLDDQLVSLYSYVRYLSVQDNTRFSSPTNHYSFSDLAAAVQTLRSENVQWLTSYIVSNNVTRDSGALSEYYRFKVEDAQRALAQQDARLFTLEETIDSYEKTNAVFLGIGTTEEAAGNAGSYEFSQQSEMYDNLISERIACQTTISEIQEQIALYQERTTFLVSDTPEEQIDFVEERLSQLNDKIQELFKETQITADEYFRTVSLKRSVQTTTVLPGSTSLLRPIIINALIAECAVFGLFVLYTVYTATRKNGSPLKERETA